MRVRVLSEPPAVAVMETERAWWGGWAGLAASVVA